MYDSGSDSTLKSDTRSLTRNQQPALQTQPHQRSDEPVMSPGLKIAVSNLLSKHLTVFIILSTRKQATVMLCS